VAEGLEVDVAVGVFVGGPVSVGSGVQVGVYVGVGGIGVSVGNTANATVGGLWMMSKPATTMIMTNTAVNQIVAQD
jgi:hypothetical protein